MGDSPETIDFDDFLKVEIHTGTVVDVNAKALELIGHAADDVIGTPAIALHPDGEARRYMNLETLVTCPVTVDHWEAELKDLIERHAAETRSRKAAEILSNWESARAHFLQVCPKEMLDKLTQPLAHDSKVVSA